MSALRRFFCSLRSRRGRGILSQMTRRQLDSAWWTFTNHYPHYFCPFWQRLSISVIRQLVAVRSRHPWNRQWRRPSWVREQNSFWLCRFCLLVVQFLIGSFLATIPLNLHHLNYLQIRNFSDSPDLLLPLTEPCPFLFVRDRRHTWGCLCRGQEAQAWRP